MVMQNNFACLILWHMFLSDCESMDKLKSILHESVLMKSLHHDNILKILGVCLETDIQGGTVYIVLPYMVNGDLKTYLKNQRQSIIKRISQSFIHRVSHLLPSSVTTSI